MKGFPFRQMHQELLYFYTTMCFNVHFQLNTVIYWCCLDLLQPRESYKQIPNVIWTWHPIADILAFLSRATTQFTGPDTYCMAGTSQLRAADLHTLPSLVCVRDHSKIKPRKVLDHAMIPCTNYCSSSD